MITVEEAEQLIASHCRSFGVESVPILAATGRVLAEDLHADRDFPPFNRVSMDGIAIQYEAFLNGARQFLVSDVQAAGAAPLQGFSKAKEEGGQALCLEIMTGAAMPAFVDTVVPYEKIEWKDGIAILKDEALRRGQNIHALGRDRKTGDLLLRAGSVLDSAGIGIAATIGKANVLVKKLPRVALLSSGDELVEVYESPLPHQIRKSNSYSIHALLQTFGIQAITLHLNDDYSQICTELRHVTREFDLVVVSGGISMGKFDFLPKAMMEVGIQQQFHKVKQRPGKPFWFGTFGSNCVVFALPGNPVSTFMCAHRYLLPWLRTSLGMPPGKPKWAILSKEIRFEAALQYFVQVTLRQDERARLWADPLEGHGSGDHANLLDSDAFMELPLGKDNFSPGEIYPVWEYNTRI